MPKRKKRHFGDLPPMYKFMFNPYPDQRVWKCPMCENKMGQRKLPLLIHIDPNYMIALNYTNRYCKHCDLLIAHKHEIEQHLTTLFRQHAPEVIGNDYLVFGTVEKKAWRENMKQPKDPREMMPHIHDFAEYYQELRRTRAGWYPDDMEPPIEEPPPSKGWVKKVQG